MSENIARIVNLYRGFYFRKKHIGFTKPVYVNRNGVIELLANPLENVKDLEKLADMNFLKEIGKNDYWYNYYEKYGLNRKIHFPYSYYLLRSLLFMLGSSIEKEFKKTPIIKFFMKMKLHYHCYCL